MTSANRGSNLSWDEAAKVTLHDKFVDQSDICSEFYLGCAFSFTLLIDGLIPSLDPHFGTWQRIKIYGFSKSFR